MNSISLRTLALLVAVAVLAAIPFEAKAGSAGSFKINVPFGFIAGGEELPPGEYTVRRISANTGTFFIESDEGGTSVAVLTAGTVQQGFRPSPAKLVFREYDGVHFLSEIWMKSDNGRQLAAPEEERDMAARGVEPSVVAVVSAGR